MKKILLSLILMAFAATTMTAQTATQPATQVKKECCKDKKMEGKKCDKPADQQCDDCKAKAAEGMKHECKEGMKDCKKAEGQCPKEAAAKKDCCKDKNMAEGMKHQECKDHKDGQPCNKPADQQCPDCKEKAKKN